MMDFISQHAGLIGLVFFFLFFCIVALWVYRPGGRQTYQDYAKIPLEDK